MNTMYVVHHGMHGYLSESAIAFSNRRAAEAYAVELVRELRESGASWSGSARQGGYECTDPYSIWYISIESEPCASRAERDARIDEINES